ncbi:hypothetical protein [Nocardioides kongjuensis]|uniref:hypothetical protein n=1 Tax=Nocardioides kongjuensis TaxID=349522 RepID=UPI0031EA767A
MPPLPWNSAWPGMIRTLCQRFVFTDSFVSVPWAVSFQRFAPRLPSFQALPVARLRTLSLDRCWTTTLLEVSAVISTFTDPPPRPGAVPG